MSVKLNDPNYKHGVAAFEAKNFSQAMQSESLAEAGDADAQHRVAIMCQNGLGVVRNDARAFGMMKAAAEQGYAIAQHGLGFMYRWASAWRRMVRKRQYGFARPPTRDWQAPERRWRYGGIKKATGGKKTRKRQSVSMPSGLRSLSPDLYPGDC